MNTVFVPTDFSRSSNGGLAVAALIAEETNSTLTIHHNLTRLSTPDNFDRLDLYTTLEAEQLSRLVSDALPDSLVINEYLTHGVTADEIVGSAKRLNASLIVMGSHGVEDAGRNFIGSTVQKVIRLASVPVILAKEKANPRLPRKIVFPFRFDENVEKPFGEVQRLAAQFGATIHLLFVNTPSNFKDSKTIHAGMEKFAAAFPDQKFVMEVYDHKDVVTGIIEHAKSIDADLIALVTHDRVHHPQYQIGITETVVFHSEIPVLSVNSKTSKPGFGPEPTELPHKAALNRT